MRSTLIRCRTKHSKLLYVCLLATLVPFSICQHHAAAAPQNSFYLPHLVPAELGFDGAQLDRIDAQVAGEIERGNLPGCVVMIGRTNGVAFARTYGNRQVEPQQEPMTLNTVFDMASITKPVATATSIMLLVERGQIRLHDPVKNYIPEFGQNGKEEITVEHLLTHQAGLIPDNPVADYEEGPEEAWKRIWALKPVAPIGEKFIYTDVGFLTLGELVHRVTGQTIAQFASENIYQPLGMRDTGFLPDAELRARAATTEQRDGKWLRGEVHDPRSALLGGVAGHAGLFSTTDDLAVYANMILHRGTLGNTHFMSPLTIAEMFRARDVAGHLRGLGWDKQSRYSSNRGELFSPQAAGHGGFTGTAIWIDPTLDLFVIFLSNRLHPDGEGNVNPLAGRIGTIAAAAICGPNPRTHPVTDSSQPARPFQGDVLLGVDVLARDRFAALAGAKIGLITNHTGLDRDGRRTIDVLHEANGVELRAIFSPEHGLQGALDQPNIDDTRDAQTGLPVYSLYGESRRPSAKQLEGLDTLVFDIQDIGCRFYTYVSTMGLAMETAAEKGLRFVVLDRPNPIGGTLIEGPVLDAGKECFVGFHTIPVRHGMTVGELAQMIRSERGLDLNLDVIRIKDWNRTDYWNRTGLTWINPSPNMRSLTQAVLYPGIGLLETTNLSVGRGTDTPFEVLGAPWIRGQQLGDHLNLLQLPGVVFVPVRFTPQASKFAGEICQGVNVVIVNRQQFRPVRTGIAIACALRKLYPDEWDVTRFNRLLLDDAVYRAVVEGTDLARIEALIQPELNDFRTRRAEFLLYQ